MIEIVVRYETTLLGRVVAARTASVTVVVLVTSASTVEIINVTPLIEIVEKDVLVKMDCDVMVVKTVEVVVVKTKVETFLVEGILVVLMTVAMAKLVKTV